MTIVIDTVKSPPLPAMHSAGVVALCRYLSLHQDNTTFKRLTQAEADALWGDGFGIVPNFEYAANDWLGGSAAAAQHVALAVSDAKALGFPQGAGIALPGSADFDMTLNQWNNAGKAYALTWAQGLKDGGYVPSVYGSYDTIQWCADLNVGYGMFWQSMSRAYSGGRNAHAHPLTHLWQQYPSINIGGQNVDQNNILQPNYGACFKGVPPVTPVSYEILLVDGVWGTKTTRRAQQFAGTPVDGQLSPGRGQSSWTGWMQQQLNNHGFRDEHGNQLVVDYDGLSFLPQDGHRTHSIAALERAMGRGVDGYLSMPSPTVAEMQTRLNANRLF